MEEYQFGPAGDNLHEAVYSVVDVETTGAMPADDRIIEFAACKVYRGTIVDEFSTLVNPGRHIPNFIRNMTGISNEMVYGAPSFERTSVEIAEFLNGTVFTAHNAQFDYGFVGREMTRAGIDFEMPQLCTRKLSSRILTDLPRKNLDQVCHHLGIRIGSRHRAFGDARATAHLLIELLELLGEKHDVFSLSELLRFQASPHRIDPHRNQSVFRKAMSGAPNSPGVYRVTDAAGEIIYVGKAKNLKMRMASYLTENARDSAKVRGMLREARLVEWEETASEVHALLKELQLIRKHRPEFNSQLVNSRRFPFVKISSSKDFGRLDLVYELDEDARYFGPFENSYVAEQVLLAADKYFKLVKCNEEFSEPFNPCLYFYMDRCKAPCRGTVTRREYEEEVDAVEEFLSGSFEKFTTELRIRLDELSKKLEFEDAAETRDLIAVLEKTSRRLRLINGPVNRTRFICGWLRDGKYEIYKINRGLLSGPVVVPRDDLSAGTGRILEESSVITNDFVPLRIVLNHSMRNGSGFFKVDIDAHSDREELALKTKTAAETTIGGGSI